MPVGGVVVVRYGFNPLEAIKNVKKKIEEISPGLPKKTLADGRVSQVKIVPFYDRTGLIYETLDTLNTALIEEVLVTVIVVIVLVGVILAGHWLPLGPAKGLIRNLMFVALLIGGLLTFFKVFQLLYPRILGWRLRHKALFLCIPLAFLLFGGMVWFGFEKVFSFAPQSVKSSVIWAKGNKLFPGLGKEFMPPLDEGSFLYMPTTMPHASIGECLDVLQKQDMAFQAIPEIDSVVGKIGRVESPLDSAPISMVETVISYKPEYTIDANGNRIRQWRDRIQSPDDISRRESTRANLKYQKG